MSKFYLSLFAIGVGVVIAMVKNTSPSCIAYYYLSFESKRFGDCCYSGRESSIVDAFSNTVNVAKMNWNQRFKANFHIKNDECINRVVVFRAMNRSYSQLCGSREMLMKI